jgi:hypothetical protein
MFTVTSSSAPSHALCPSGLRASLVVVWLLTALVSVLELQGQSRALLAASGVPPGLCANALVIAGAGLDMVVGLLLWRRPSRAVYALAAANVVLMTAVATVLLPGLWLHPLGPLTKNLPILAVLWTLSGKAPA